MFGLTWRSSLQREQERAAALERDAAVLKQQLGEAELAARKSRATALSLGKERRNVIVGAGMAVVATVVLGGGFIMYLRTRLAHRLALAAERSANAAKQAFMLEVS